MLQSGFSYESVFRFLKTGLVMPLAGLSPEVIYQAENYVIALGIRGFKRWNSTWERVYRGAELINLDELNQFREAVVTPFLPFREIDLPLQDKQMNFSYRGKRSVPSPHL